VVPGTDATAQDDDCCTVPPIPDPARPNNLLAPFWTDLDGSAAPGIFIATLTDGVDEWIVIEWRVNVFGTNSLRTFQVWIGDGAAQDITFAYDPDNLPASPGTGIPFQFGAENITGTGGNGFGTPPLQDYRVTSSDPVPGATVSYTVTAIGLIPGNGRLTTSVDTPAVPGTTIVTSNVVVLGGFQRSQRFN
jgi:hypothetical protein